MKIKPSISVIIVTKNRPQKLEKCLASLHKNTYQDFELIIVDQSNQTIHNKILRKELDKFHQCIYLQQKKTGKSKGLNLAIKHSQAPILAFTDDDCVVDKHWLKNITKSFKTQNNIVAVFGKTLPYQKDRHPNQICPSTFNKPKSNIISKPCKHWENIGFGNNMAWKKDFFTKFGLFKEWLGPGSIGSNAEDAEMINRCLVKGYKIGYEPSMLVFHNKWLNKDQMLRQHWSYVCGGMACYGWFALLGFKFAKKIVKDDLKETIKNMTWRKITARIWGLTVAFGAYLSYFFQKNHFK